MADTTDTPEENNEALQLIELEKSIKTFYNGLAMKKGEMREFREQIKHTLETDAVYAQHMERAQEVKQEQRKIQDQIMQTDTVIQAKEDMKELREEIKELNKLLSKNLLKYAQMSDSKSITMTDGETYNIQQNAKLVKQRS